VEIGTKGKRQLPFFGCKQKMEMANFRLLLQMTTQTKKTVINDFCFRKSAHLWSLAIFLICGLRTLDQGITPLCRFHTGSDIYTLGEQARDLVS
jgi:hypothetical protein